ncbi:MAG: ribulose-phosphate 3-epimerase [Bacteriovoracaceae bacterium]|nr:ribulose-phosphate 3-epimerase [Bacteriovoracaceae bacterium]
MSTNSKNVIVAPSILAANFLKLEEELELLNQEKNLWLHLDIMDGHFVPNLTFGAPVVFAMKQIFKGFTDAHLMVTNPQFHLDWLQTLGVDHVTFHWETVQHHDRLIADIKKRFGSVGVVLNPSTPLEAIPLYLLGKIDVLLLMTVNPGFAGQKFIEGVRSKIQQANKLREANHFQFQIQIDGGVTTENAGDLKRDGADILVVGSALFQSKRPYSQVIEQIQNA